MPAFVETMHSTREKTGMDRDYWYQGKMEK